MKESVKNLRDAWDAYQGALQRRYDELVDEYTLTWSDTDYILHREITNRIDLEKTAVEMNPEPPYLVSVSHVIWYDWLYTWQDGQLKKKFEL